MGLIKEEFADRIRYNRWAQLAKGGIALTKGALTLGKRSRLNCFANAYRDFLGAGFPGCGEILLNKWAPTGGGERSKVWFKQKVGWERYGIGDDSDGLTKLNRSLILKEPGDKGEKGVLMVWFEMNLIALLRLPRIEALLQEYQIIFASSWSPPYFQAIWPFAGIPGAELFLMVSNPHDEGWFKCQWPEVSVIPLYMSSWTDPDLFEPLSLEERDIDLLMVANWAPFKRHWLLFKALGKMDPDLHIALVGQPESGRTEEDIRILAKRYGVRQKLSIFNRLPVEEVYKLQCRSRASVILSRREGACVVVAESFFANTPVGLLAGAHIGSSAFINGQSGAFLREKYLAEDLQQLLDKSARGEYDARNWACDHITYKISNAELNDQLKSRTESLGRVWIKNMVPMYCQGAPRYVKRDDACALSGEYERLEKVYGVKIAIP